MAFKGYGGRSGTSVGNRAHQLLRKKMALKEQKKKQRQKAMIDSGKMIGKKIKADKEKATKVGEAESTESTIPVKGLSLSKSTMDKEDHEAIMNAKRDQLSKGIYQNEEDSKDLLAKSALSGEQVHMSPSRSNALDGILSTFEASNLSPEESSKRRKKRQFTNNY